MEVSVQTHHTPGNSGTVLKSPWHISRRGGGLWHAFFEKILQNYYSKMTISIRKSS